MVKLDLYRFTSDSNTTCGILMIDGTFECFILEDEYRVVKVKGMTRIPAGEYGILYRKEASTLTTQYRIKYTWFDWHLELQEVPGFTHVYIHVGNWHTNTDACLLTGQTCDPYGAPDNVGRSTEAFKLLYMKLRPHLLQGERVVLTIHDCDGKT